MSAYLYSNVHFILLSSERTLIIFVVWEKANIDKIDKGREKKKKNSITILD